MKVMQSKYKGFQKNQDKRRIKKALKRELLTGNVLDLLSIQIAMLADKVLNFWVRDGTRCDHFSIITGS